MRRIRPHHVAFGAASLALLMLFLALTGHYHGR